MNPLAAQTISCSDFLVLGFAPEQNSTGNSIVNIQLNGNASDFINYPYISIITDCNGDTIATGTLNFFGQLGQSVQSYPVSGDITNACLPISIEFMFGNTNFELDTCVFSLSALPTPLACADFIPIDIESDLTNTLINISMQGTGNTYITYPAIAYVTDCSGDTIATGFSNSAGQIGLSTQGYPITALANPVCYPISIMFIYGNTNFQTDTCLLTLNNPTGNQAYAFIKSTIGIFPNPSNNTITLRSIDYLNENIYSIYDHQGKLITSGPILSENTFLNISSLSNGLYFIKIGNDSIPNLKFIKQ